MKPTMLSLLFFASSIHGYEVYLDEIINETPYDLTFESKHVSYPASLPEASFQEPEKPTGSRLPLPLTIKADTRKRFKKKIVTDSESQTIVEIFFNFRDKNNNLVSILSQPGRMVKFAPFLGWARKGVTFADPDKTYHLTFIFSGNNGIEDAQIIREKSYPIKRSSRSRT